MRIGTTPQGQGHRTVCAQVVADALGVEPADVDVLTEMDTVDERLERRLGQLLVALLRRGRAAPSTWPRSRSPPSCRTIAAAELGCDPAEVELREGARVARERSRSRCAAWPASRTGTRTRSRRGSSPGCTRPPSPPPRTWRRRTSEDRVASSAAHGFIADVAVVEVDRETGAVTVLDYATVHDAGRLLNPLLAEGQVRGGFAHGAGAALFERVVYDEDGNLLTGSFVDYLCPTAPDLPPLRLGAPGDAVAVHARWAPRASARERR